MSDHDQSEADRQIAAQFAAGIEFGELLCQEQGIGKEFAGDLKTAYDELMRVKRRIHDMGIPKPRVSGIILGLLERA